MNALLANPVALTILPALAAGVLLGLLAWVSGGNRVTMAVGWGLGVLFIYWLLEGVPPFPPVAAKQKLGYLLAVGSVVGLVFSFINVPRWVFFFKSIAMALLALGWLGWAKFGDADNVWTVVLAVLVTMLIGRGSLYQLPLAVEAADASHEHPFIAPAALMTTAIAGAIVATTGLFLGMGQILGALAALLGGALAVGYLALLIRGHGVLLMPKGSVPVVAYAVLCGAVLTALLGPSVNAPALLILATGPILTALLAPRIAAAMPNIPLLRPILAGAVIAIPAIIASLIAVLTGTSPFA